jgi:hypothetical protein
MANASASVVSWDRRGSKAGYIMSDSDTLPLILSLNLSATPVSGRTLAQTFVLDPSRSAGRCRL